MITNAHQFSFPGLSGNEISLQDFAGKTILIVNTASKCGFTPQYQGLEEVWQNYKDMGLMVLGVPSNDFANQEPGTALEIKEFCDLKYKVTFPMTDKTKITGGGAHPFYHWVAGQVGFVGRPHWNFYKYIVDGEGRLVDWFSSLTKPQSTRLMGKVLSTLKAKQRVH